MTNKPASAAARAGPSVRCWRGSALCSAGRNRPASGWSASGWRCGRCGAAQGARPVLQVRPRPRPGGCLAGAWPRTGGALPGTAQPVERAVGSVGATGRGDGCAAGQAHGAGAAFPAGTRPFRRPPVAPDVITVEGWHAALRGHAREARIDGRSLRITGSTALRMDDEGWRLGGDALARCRRKNGKRRNGGAGGGGAGRTTLRDATPGGPP